MKKNNENEIIKKYTENIFEMQNGQIEELFHQMNLQQPYLIDYFVKEIENTFSTEEKDIFLYYCLLIWYVLSQGDKPLTVISNRKILRVKEKNLKYFYNLDGKERLSIENKLEKLCLNFNRSEFLKFLFSILSEEVSENIEIRNENIGLMLFHFRIIIECLSEISIEDSLVDKISDFFGIKL
jgi:hypothetical protein